MALKNEYVLMLIEHKINHLNGLQAHEALAYTRLS